MGRRVNRFSTKEYLESAALPSYSTGRYAVISHKEIMDMSSGLLNHYGLNVEHELFKCNSKADVAQGIYHIKDLSDPEMGMIFAWVNSYDKSKRFQCCIGGVLTMNHNYFVADMGSWTRKHTGNAKQEAFDQMKDQISNAAGYYLKILQDKAAMKLVIVPLKQRAEILGRLLFQDRILTMEQGSVVKSQLIAPGAVDYNAPQDSLWTFYNQMAVALKKSHPRDWLDDQKKLHAYLVLEFGIGQPAPVTQVITQLDLIDSTTEVEAEKNNKEPEISFEL